jgi:hypothetical protein
MIKLYRKEDSKPADAIEAEFRELTLGYDRLVVAEQDAKQLFGEEASFPVIANNDKVVSGEQIPAYLKDLRFQGDFCYVDEDGETC